MSLSMCTVSGMVINNGASDAAPQEPHDLNWLHTRYDGGPIRREDIGDVFHSVQADGIQLTLQQAHQLAGVAHGIVKRHGDYRYSRGYAHGRSDGAREGLPGQPRCEVPVSEFAVCGQPLLTGEDICGKHLAASYVDIIETQRREIELLRAEQTGSLIERARNLLGHRVRVWPAFDAEKSGPTVVEGVVRGIAPAPSLTIETDDGELEHWMVTLPHEDLGRVDDEPEVDDEDLDEGDDA